LYQEDLYIATGLSQISYLDSALDRNYCSVMPSSGVEGPPVFMARYAENPPFSSLWDEPVKVSIYHRFYYVGPRYLGRE